MSAAAVTVGSTLLLSGCSAARDVVVVAKGVAVDAGRLERSHWLPPRTPPRALWPDDDAIAAAGRRIESSIAGLDLPTRKQIVSAGCEAVAAQEVLDGDTSVGDYITAHVGGTAAYRLEVFDLAQKLQAAQSAGDVADALTSAALCEWASE